MLVIKVGGSLSQLDPLLRDVASWQDPLVVVHGANRELNDLSARLGHPPRLVTSERGELSRFTDAETMDYFLMAYAGKVNNGDHSGPIERIEPKLLRLLLDAGYLPVLTPPAISHEGVAINVDGDRLAMEVGAAMGADRLLIFADTPGFLRDPDDESTLVATIAGDEIDNYFSSARGRARVKLLAAQQALRRGIKAVALADGRREHPLLDAMKEAGTWIRE